MRTKTLGASALLPSVALAVAVLFGFQDARVVAASIAVALVDLAGVSSGVVAGVVVVLAGLSSFAVPLVPHSSRRRILLAVGIAVALRIILQVTAAPLFAMAVAAIGLALILVLIGMSAVTYGGRVTGTAMLLGASFDIALMVGRRTLDLTRSTGIGGLVVVVLLGLVAMSGLSIEQQVGGSRRYGLAVPASGLFLIGPWFALHLLLTGNIGVIATISGAPLWLAAGAGLLGSIGALSWSAPGRIRTLPSMAGLVVVLGLGTVLRADGGWVLLLVAIVAMAAGATLTGSLERESLASPRRLGWSLAAGLAAGYVVVAAIETSIVLPIGLSGDAWYPVVGLLLLAAAAAASTHRWEPSQAWLMPPLIALALLLVPAWLWVSDPHSPLSERISDPEEQSQPIEDVILATYNLNHGFDPQGVLDLAAIVAVLEETAWEVAGVQEVSRGRLRDGGLDMVAWLEHELGLTMYWQQSGTRFTGNALVTRFEVSLADSIELLDADGKVGSVIDATLTLPGLEAPVRIFVVGVGETTADLLEPLIERWQFAPATVVLGDFGGRDLVESIVAAGFYDVTVLVDGSAATYPSDGPTEQRDTVLISRDLLPSAVRIIQSIASDHLPVAVRIVLGPSDQ